MDSNISSNISSFANKEAVKVEMLDLLIEFYELNNINLDKKSKDFAMVRLDEMLDEYDVGAPVVAYRLDLDGVDDELFVPISFVDDIFDNFRSKIAKVLFELLVHNIGVHLSEREEE